jgi:hypothetical protein
MSKNIPSTLVEHTVLGGSPIPSLNLSVSSELPGPGGSLYAVPAGAASAPNPYDLRRPPPHGSCLRGLRVTFDDDSVGNAGTQEGERFEHIFRAGEYVQETTICRTDWGGGRAAGIVLKTNFNRFQMGYCSGGSTDNTEGWLVGVYGGSGADLDSLGIFLSRIQVECTFVNVKYDPPLDQCVPGQEPISVLSQVVTNNSSAEQSQTLTFKHSVTTTTSCGNSFDIALGAKVEFEAGLPIVAKSKVELSTELKTGFTWGNEKSTTEEYTYECPVVVPAHTRLKATQTIYLGKLNLKYTADLAIAYHDGTSETFPQQHGWFRSTTYTEAETVIDGSAP